ncbi:HEAT repeat domain-containing protein [Candidatus Peregrinibacteria bacterium]|nr:HEAT repeat domain-containing protein [Candidatus Peregrinibacteria bacterium]
MGCLVLFTALLFITINQFVFIILSIGALAVFFSQIYILNTAFIEDLFSPLESQRTFPIIESAETIGGIIGGLLITFFAGQIQSFIMIYIMIVSLLLICPIVFAHRQLLKKLPFIRFKKKKITAKLSLQVIKESFAHMGNYPFFKVILMIILGQWIITNLLDFQYTSAVYEGVSESVNAEAELTHGLGSLHIIFYSFALFMQLIVASRIISSLGIVGSLMLHPLVTLFSLSVLFFRFGFTSAVLTKLNFEMTNIVYLNAYHSTYYALEHKAREQLREVLEGFAQPVGSLLGMFFLLFFEFIFKGNFLTTAVTVFMAVIASGMLFVLLKNEHKYTHISVKNLLHSNNIPLQLNAIEVLAQKGHKGTADVLTKTLKSKQIDTKVRIKILETLGHMQEKKSLLEIIDNLKSDSANVRSAALKALNKFEKIEKDIINFPFSNHRINEELQKLFAIESDKNTKALIISIIIKINKNNLVPFVFELLNSKDNRLIADSIAVCSYFNDINLLHYLLPFLESDDPKIRGNTVVALWQFKHYRAQLLPVLEQLLNSKVKQEKIAGIRVVGEIKAVYERIRLRNYIQSDDNETRLEAGIALCKMGYNEGVLPIIDMIVSDNQILKDRALHAVESMNKNIIKNINSKLLMRISAYINTILSESDTISFDDLPIDRLIKLRNAYELVNDHEEVENINAIIDNKKRLLNILQFNPS